jgi:glucose-6-phosphate dehydrogenase assembly protein OpcA
VEEAVTDPEQAKRAASGASGDGSEGFARAGSVKLERFSAGESFAVNPDAIERELAALWREAGKTTDVHHPVTRACLWNVAVHLEERKNREGFGQADALLRMVADLPKHLAARALVLRTSAEGEAELESWISANCILAEGGSKLVCSEEITIAAKNEGERHLPGLVRALLVPAVPTAAVFAGAPPPNSSPLAAVAKQAERIVTDVDRSITERPLSAVREAIDRAPLMAMDLGWLRTAPLRAVIAELFDPPLTLDSVGGIGRVRMVSPRDRRWSSQAMLGWIAVALGVNAGPRGPGGSSWSLPTNRGGELALTFEVADVPGLHIEFHTRKRSAPIVIHAVSEKVVEVPTPLGGTARKSIAHAEGAALLARALATRSDDQSFASAMFVAGDL